VTEELGQQQRLHESGAVDLDDGRRGAGARFVQRLGDQLLARAALAEHEHRRVGAADLADRRGELLHGGRGAHQTTGAERTLARALGAHTARLHDGRGGHVALAEAALGARELGQIAAGEETRGELLGQRRGDGVS
jgi:hypothetical protein